jgi:predicted RNA binding protein YcfA (HicA-like mRNA interferase family)
VGRTFGGMSVSEVLAMLRVHGWFLVSVRGGQRHFKHQVRHGRVTIAGRIGDVLSMRALESILQRAGIIL